MQASRGIQNLRQQVFVFLAFCTCSARTKAGLNTKLNVSVDGRSQLQALILTAGTEADVVHTPALQESVDARHVLMDKAYDSGALRELIARKGMKSCIQPRSNRVAPATYDKKLYEKRHRVENFFEKIKRMRRVYSRAFIAAMSFL